MGQFATKGKVTLVSLGGGERFSALRRFLGELEYSVDVASPFMTERLAADAAAQVVYLGPRQWPSAAVQTLADRPVRPVQLLAVDLRAFDWGQSLVRRCPEFVRWPCPQQELKLRLERICGGTAPVQSNRRTELLNMAQGLGLIGRSAAFVDALVLLKRFAQCDATVLIHGETGTGKELAARAIHALSARSQGPFVAVSCGAIPDNLIESELFGHEKGAFTDAKDARPGLVAMAQRGTLFLDEVEALSPKGQVALLRFLESHEYRRIGGGRTMTADLRIVAAGNENFHALVRRGTFRRDLLYRLNVLALTMPPLRGREGDAELLAEHFIGVHSRRYQRSPAALGVAWRQWLATQRWPGNVRELENLVHRAVVSSSGWMLDLGTAITGEVGEETGTPHHNFSQSKRDAIDSFEHSYLIDLMRSTHGNVTQAAQRSGKERRALGKLLKKHAIHSAEYRTE